MHTTAPKQRRVVGMINVGFAIYEFDKFLPGYLDLLAYNDINIVARKDHLDIVPNSHYMPHCVDLPVMERKTGSSLVYIGSWVGRKNTDQLPPEVNKYFYWEPDITDRFLNNDIFITVSRGEGFCLPVIEAQFYGLSTIVTDCGAFQDCSTVIKRKAEEEMYCSCYNKNVVAPIYSDEDIRAAIENHKPKVLDFSKYDMNAAVNYWTELHELMT